MPVVNINVSVVGVQQLTLAATNGVAGSINYDHADWAGRGRLAFPPSRLPIQSIRIRLHCRPGAYHMDQQRQQPDWFHAGPLDG